jgi:hypothetical protein
MNNDRQQQGGQDQDSELNASNDGAGGGSSGADGAGELTQALAESGDAQFVHEQTRSISRSTIATFAVLILGAGAVFFMYKRAGPQSAAAAVSKETTEAKKTISTFLSGGDSNMKAMEQMLRNTQKIVQQFLSYPSMTQVPLSDLRSNPFKFKTNSPQATADNSGASDAADKKRREDERQAIVKAVGGFQVQSIMYGDTRRACMINNTLFKEGGQIDNFTIEKINQNSVIVKNGPYRFELKMQR